MNFDAMNFVRNLKYMGLGLIGIFAAIGVIAVSILILNAIGAKKAEKDLEK